MTTIERVAKAAFAADYPHDNWDRLGKNGHAQTRYLKLARAAIEALREPTPSALTAGKIARNQYDNTDKTLRIWQAICDAALAEDADEVTIKK